MLTNRRPAVFGALRGSRKMIVTDAIMGAITIALLVNIVSSPIVSGANG